MCFQVLISIYFDIFFILFFLYFSFFLYFCYFSLSSNLYLLIAILVRTYAETQLPPNRCWCQDWNTNPVNICTETRSPPRAASVSRLDQHSSHRDSVTTEANICAETLSPPRPTSVPRPGYHLGQYLW